MSGSAGRTCATVMETRQMDVERIEIKVESECRVSFATNLTNLVTDPITRQIGGWVPVDPGGL